MNKKEFKQLKKCTKFRIRCIEYIREAVKISQDPDWQRNKTPMKIVDKMVSKTNVIDKTILVLFNIEFVERLIYKYNVLPENIFFFADHWLEKLYVESFYGVKSILGDKSLMSGENKLLKRILEMGQKNLGLVFSNPPYNRGMDLKIIRNVLPLCKEMVVVHPSTWLLDLKSLTKTYVDFKEIIKNNLKSVKLFNGNPIFDIGLFLPCAITHIDKSHNGTIGIDYFGDKYTISNIDDITKFGKEWKTTVKPFMKRIEEYISENSNVWQHNKLEINTKKFYCQLAAIRGNVNCTNFGSTIIAEDFYTMVMRNSEENKGIRQPKLKRPGNPTPTFEFNTVVEMNNFIKYCKTDFARFCLALYKNGQNMSVGEMALIPWIDFTEEWDDKKLYNYFKIDEKTQKYIEEFLPDYYGIRTNTGEKK